MAIHVFFSLPNLRQHVISFRTIERFVFQSMLNTSAESIKNSQINMNLLLFIQTLQNIGIITI